MVTRDDIFGVLRRRLFEKIYEDTREYGRASRFKEQHRGRYARHQSHQPTHVIYNIHSIHDALVIPSIVRVSRARAAADGADL